MSSFEQRERLQELIMDQGLGAVRFRRVPSTKVWGGQPRIRGGLGAVPRESHVAANKQLLNWIEQAFGPEAAELVRIQADELAAAEANGNGNGNGLAQAEGETDERKWWEKITDAASEVLPKYLQYKTQSDILEVQLDRAREGLPPLQAGEYAPSVQVGLDPETVDRIADEAQRRAAGAAGGLMRSPLTWILAGSAAFFLLQDRNGKRRR